MMVAIDVEPVIDFLGSLNPPARAKAYRGIDLLAKTGRLSVNLMLKEFQAKKVSVYCVKGIAICKYACSSFRPNPGNWQW
jgi:hypothetical protein